MDASKFDINDYMMTGTVQTSSTTTHPTGGSAATDQIGVWVRRSIIGRGSSGVVSLQEHTTTGALRAVKMLNRGTPAVIRREINSMLFLKNYRRLFVDFLAWYELDTTYIAMEYVSGGDLQAYIGTVGAVEEGVAKGIAEQILQALYVLHEHGFIHCDLKPENIFIAGLCPVTIKVADLGQTKKPEGSYNSTSGTRAWAAPEQSTPNYVKSVDMWGAGCVVYFLLTSLNPFLSENDKSPIATVAKYTFPVWPRLLRDKFQVHPTRRIPGDQIIVRGVSTEANHFLSNLIVRSPTDRMSVYAALQHSWICNSTPLESALRQGDLPLSRLLARRDQRYKEAWDNPLPDHIVHVILRFAAANGHRGLVTLALDALSYWWKPASPELSSWPGLLGWPNTSCALIGAAKSGHLEIMNLLLQSTRLCQKELTHDILLQAFLAALQGGHQEIQSVLLPHVKPAMFGCHEWCGMVAGYMDLTMLITTIEGYKKKSTSKSGLVRVDVDCFGYRVFFPTMLTAAMETGNIENIKHLLSDPPARQMLVKANIVEQAAGIGRLDVVRLLVECYTTELGITSRDLERVLYLAAKKGHVEVVQYMLTRGVFATRETLEHAVLQKNKAIVELLLNALMQVGSQSSIETAQQWAKCAIPLCSVELLRWLDNPRSQFHFTNITGETPSRGLDICDAACAGDLNVVIYLLTNKQPYSGPTPLRSLALIGAINGGHLSMIWYLGLLSIDLTDRELWRVGARKGQVAVLELLLKRGRPLQGVMDQALGSAAKAGHFDAVMFLLDNGALWDGPCGPVISGVLAAFGHRGGALPEIGGPAGRRL